MKPDPFQPPLQQKPAPPRAAGGSRYFRCCLFVFVGGIAVCAGCCGIGNYVLFHTTIPLTYVERALEETGDVEIDGMSGTFSSGFHVDQLRVRAEDGKWNELNDVDFRFNGLYALVNEQRLIIEQFTVGSGELYYRPIETFTSDDTSTDADANNQADDAGTTDDMPGPIESSGNVSGMKEFRVDLFRLSNLKFINRQTNVEFKIDEISIQGFQILDDRLTSLGDVTVKSDHVEFRTEPSDRFKDQPADLLKRKFTGLVRAAASDRLLKDIPYAVDVCFARNGRFIVEAQAFDDKATYTLNPQGEVQIAFRDFSLSDYLKWDEGVLPSHLTGSVSFTQPTSPAEDFQCTIAPDSKFQLGETAFTIETTEWKFDKQQNQMPPLTALGGSQENPIRLRLTMLEQKPYLAITLQSNDEDNTPELFSKTIYAKAWSELTDEQKKLINETIKANKEDPAQESPAAEDPAKNGASATTSS